LVEAYAEAGVLAEVEELLVALESQEHLEEADQRLVRQHVNTWQHEAITRLESLSLDGRG
jgi:hypothetical protein